MESPHLLHCLRRLTSTRRSASPTRPHATASWRCSVGVASSARGTGAARVRRIATATGWVRPDLADRERRLVLEADSFAWHSDRAALRRDARRYHALVAQRWVVLRFSWEDVMLEPGRVRDVLGAVVARRTETSCARCGAP